MSITDNQQVLFSKSNYPLPHNWLPFSTCILFHKIVMYYHLLDYFSGFSCLFYLWLRFSTFTLLHIWIFEGRMPCKKTAETIFRGFCWMPLWTVQMEYTALLYIFRTQFGNTVSWMPSNYLVWNTVIWPRSSAIKRRCMSAIVCMERLRERCWVCWQPFGESYAWRPTAPLQHCSYLWLPWYSGLDVTSVT